MMVCEMCGKESARIRKVARTYGKGKNIFILDNIPILFCNNCGESYIEAETLHEIEQIKLHKKGYIIKRTAPMVSFTSCKK